MSFVAIAFLSALPLALAPILLHFFDRRRKVVIYWGAMQFLQEAAARRTSARKLQQWLLLLLRTAAIAALVFAIAGPLLPTRWSGAEQRQQWIFILDNSMSTAWVSEADQDPKPDPTPATLLSEIAAAVQQQIDDRPNNDSVRLLAASPHPTWLNASGARLTPVDREQLRAELQRLKPTEASSDLLASLLAAVQAEAEHQYQSRRIVLLTDGQATDWKTRNHGGWTRFRQALASADIPTQVEVEIVGAGNSPRQNLAVTEVTASRQALGPNQTLTVTALTQNFSDQPTPPLTARWITPGERLHAETIPELAPGGVHQSTWRVAFDTPRPHLVRYTIDSDDALSMDNVNSVVVDVRKEIPILVIDSSTSLARIRQDAYYVHAALGHLEGEPTRWQSVYKPSTIAPHQLQTTELTNFAAIVIPSLSELTAVAVERLERHVARGGALWVAAGPRTDIQTFNEQLYKAGAGLSPLSLETLQDYFDTTKPTIDAAQHNHVANRRLKDDQRLDLADVKVDRSFRFSAASEQEQQLATVLLTLSNSEPLLVENTFGKGRVFVMSAPLQLQWSELVLSQSFVVMMEDYLAYLTAPSTPRHNLQAGEPLICEVVQGSADGFAASAVLQNPHGKQSQLTPELTARGAQFRTTRTQLPGIYKLRFPDDAPPLAAAASNALGGTDGIAFHVARPLNESKFTALDKASRETLATLAGIDDGVAQSPDFGDSQRQPLWPLVLVLILVMLLAELLLAGVIGRARHGITEPINGAVATAAPYTTNAGRVPTQTSN